MGYEIAVLTHNLHPAIIKLAWSTQVKFTERVVLVGFFAYLKWSLFLEKAISNVNNAYYQYYSQNL